MLRISNEHRIERNTLTLLRLIELGLA